MIANTMFPEKAPFGVPNLFNQGLRSDLHKILSSKSYLVTPDEFRKIYSYNTSPRDAFRIISAILMEIDEFGTYSLPVLKALNILYIGLKENANSFVDACKSLTPEIRSILFLSFGEKSDPYRDQVHAMAHTIYEFLAYSVPLPEQNEATKTHRSRSNTVTAKARPRKPAPPPVPVSPPKPEPPKEEDEDEELPFDLRRMQQQKSWRNSFNPFSSNNQLINFSNEPQPEKENVDAGQLLDSLRLVTHQPEPQPEPELLSTEEVEDNTPKPEGLQNPREVTICTEFQIIKKPIYDDTIESY